MAKAIFEIHREGNSILLWDAGIGHRIVFPTEVFAMLQEGILLRDERRFHAAKEQCGVAVIDAYGELVSPYEYLERLFKAYQSKIGQHLGIAVYKNLLRRPETEYW